MKRAAFAALTALLLLGFGACTAELALQLFDPPAEERDPFEDYAAWGHRRSALFGFEARKDHRWFAGGTHYSTDARGFRSNVGEAPAQPGLRIAALGGSSVFGFGLPDDGTWPERLENALRSQGMPGVEVINAGNIAHNSLQLLLRYYLRVRQAKPTHLLIYSARNDTSREPGPPDRLFISERLLFAQNLADARGQGIASTPLERSRLYQRLRAIFAAEPLSATASEKAPVTPAQERTALEHNVARFRRNLLTLSDMARRDGVELLLATFVFAPEPLLPAEVEQIRALNEVIREVARDENRGLVDLARAFDAESDPGHFFFPDGYHPNAEGAAWIAAQLAAALPALISPQPLAAPPR